MLKLFWELFGRKEAHKMKWCTNPSNCSSLALCRSSIQSHLCPGPLSFPEGIGQYIKSGLKLLSCWHISLMKSPSDAAVVADVHSSFADASTRGVLSRAPVGCAVEPPKAGFTGLPWGLWLPHQVGACCCSLWLTGAFLGKPEFWPHPAERLSLGILLFQHYLVEIFLKTSELWNPYRILAVLAEDISPWLSAAFCNPQLGHLTASNPPAWQGPEAMNPLLAKRKVLGVETYKKVS